MALVIEIAAENDDEDANITWTDITAYVKLETADQGGTFVVGGSALQGTVGAGSGFDLKDDAGTRSLPVIRVVRAVETATTPDTVLFRGRVDDKASARGEKHTGDARALDVSLVDYNKDLGGIIVQEYSRPLEPDWQRILGLQRDYLDGTASRRLARARPSTKLAVTYLSHDNPTDVHSFVYREGVNGQKSNPYSVVADVLGSSEKVFFITVDGEIFFDLADSTAYASTLSITDSSPNLTSSFPPGDPVANTSANDFASGLIGTYDGPESYYTSDPTIVALHDKWDEHIQNNTAVLAKSQAMTRRALSIRKYENTTYSCRLKLLAADVGKIKYGQTISVRSAAMGLTSATTLRIVRLMWRIAGIGPSGVASYYAELEMVHPRALISGGGGPGDDDEPHVPPVDECDLTAVQRKSINGDQFTLDSAPTPGNTLVVRVYRAAHGGIAAGAAATAPDNTTDWHFADGAVLTFDENGDSSNLRGGHVGIWYRYIQAGDPAGVWEWPTGISYLEAIEFPGQRLDDTAILSNQASTLDINAGGSVTTTDGPAIVMGAVLIHNGLVSMTLTPDAGVTERLDHDITSGGGGGQFRWFWSGEREVASAGATSVGATESANARPYCGVTVAFLCANISPDPDPSPPHGQPVTELLQGDCETLVFDTNYPYLAQSLEVEVEDPENPNQWIPVTVEETDPAIGRFTFEEAPCNLVVDTVFLTALDPDTGNYSLLFDGAGRGPLTGEEPVSSSGGRIRVRYLAAGLAPPVTPPPNPDPLPTPGDWFGVANPWQGVAFGNRTEAPTTEPFNTNGNQAANAVGGLWYSGSHPDETILENVLFSDRADGENVIVLDGLTGTAGHPVIIQDLDFDTVPQGIYMVDCSYVTIRRLRMRNNFGPYTIPGSHSGNLIQAIDCSNLVIEDLLLVQPATEPGGYTDWGTEDIMNFGGGAAWGDIVIRRFKFYGGDWNSASGTGFLIGDGDTLPGGPFSHDISVEDGVLYQPGQVGIGTGEGGPYEFRRIDIIGRQRSLSNDSIQLRTNDATFEDVRTDWTNASGFHVGWNLAGHTFTDDGGNVPLASLPNPSIPL